MNSQGVILVLDLGTTHLKATVFTPEAAVIAQASAAYPTESPRAQWTEQDSDHWWDAAVEATREALAASASAGYPPSQVQAIGVTGQMHGLVPLDRAGAAIAPCLTVQDRRAVTEVGLIERELGPGRVYALSGARLEPASPLAKLRWMASHQPDLLQRTRLLLPPKDFLRYRLTAVAATEPIDAAGTLLYDLRRGQWSEELIAAAHISPDILPPVSPSHRTAGPLRAEPAAALGLPAGIPVAMGAGDDVECLGAGLLAAGQAVEHLGTTGSILVCTDTLIADPDGHVDCYPHAVPGMYLVGGSTSSAGASLAWALREVEADQSRKGEEAIEALLRVRDGIEEDAGADLVFLPYLAGERCPVWHTGGRGMLLGMTLSTSREQIIQAVFAGVTFSLRHILDCIVDLGLPVEHLVVSGGGGTFAGEAWHAFRSTVYRRPLLQPPSSDSTSLGTLMLTLTALGVFEDAHAAAKHLAPSASARVEPKPAYAAGIERRYALYRAVAAAALPLFDHWPH